MLSLKASYRTSSATLQPIFAKKSAVYSIRLSPSNIKIDFTMRKHFQVAGRLDNAYLIFFTILPAILSASLTH